MRVDSAVSWRYFSVFLKVLARVALAGIMVLTVMDVGGRYLLNAPVEGATVIITDLLFPAVVFLSLAYVAEVDGHVRVELVWNALPPRIRRALEMVFAIVIAAFWALIAYRAGLRAYDAYLLNQRPIAAVGIPVAISYGVVCVGSASAVVATLVAIKWRAPNQADDRVVAQEA